MQFVWNSYGWLKSFWAKPEVNDENCKELLYLTLSEQSQIMSTYCDSKRLLNYHMPQHVRISCNMNFQDKELDTIKYVYKINSCDSKNNMLLLGNGMDFSGYASLKFVVDNKVGANVLKLLARDIVSHVRALHKESKILGPINENMILICGNNRVRDPQLFFLSLNHYYKPRNIEHEKSKDMYRIMKIMYDAVEKGKKTEKKNPKDDMEFITWLEHNDIFKITSTNPIYRLIIYMDDEKYEQLWDLDPLKPFVFEENPGVEEKTEEVVEEKTEEVVEALPPPKPKGKVKISNELKKAYDKLPDLTDPQKGDINTILQTVSSAAGNVKQLIALAQREEKFKEITDAIEAKVPFVKIMEFWLSSKKTFDYLKALQKSDILWRGMDVPQLWPPRLVFKPGFLPKFVLQMKDASITDPSKTNAQEIIHYFDIITQRVNVDISDLKQYLLKSDYDAFITNLLTKKNFESSMNVRSRAKSRSSSAETQQSGSRSIQLSASSGLQSSSSRRNSDSRISDSRASSRAQSRISSRTPSVSQQRSRNQSVSTPVCDALATSALECVTQCQNMEDVHYPFRVVMNVQNVLKCYNVQTLYEYQDSLPEFKWWRNMPTFLRDQRDFIVQKYTFLHNNLVAHVAKTINYMLRKVNGNTTDGLSYTKESKYVSWEGNKEDINAFTQKQMNVNRRKYLKTRLFCNGVPALEINGCGYNNNVPYVGRFSLFSSEFDTSQKTISCAWNKYGDLVHDEIKNLLKGRHVNVSRKGLEWISINPRGELRSLYVPFGFQGIAAENYRINKKN
uniref:Uncharacterized protein n=1 Tax=viral metagenome TaxID=1070528 RepID=A0A6C0CN43_9ZZZZ